MKEEIARAANAFRFHVYRSPLRGGRRFEKLTKVAPVAGPRVEKGYRYWIFADTSADPKKSYSYAIAPVSLFKTELRTRSFVKYKVPETKVAAMQAPAFLIKVLTFTEDKHPDLKWEFGAAEEKKIRGFVVERQKVHGTQWERRSALLGRDVRHYVDPQVQPPGAAFLYRVAAIGRRKGQVQVSNTFLATYLPGVQHPVPPRPTGLKTRWVRKDNRNYIHVSWDPKDPKYKLTSYYVILRDDTQPGQFGDYGRLPRDLATEREVEVHNPESREVTIRVVGVTKQLWRGPYAESKCFVPGRLYPKPELTHLHRDDSSRGVVIQWKFSDRPDLKGFRLYEHDKMMADETKLGPNIRQFTLEPLVIAKLYDFEIQAVSKYGILSPHSFSKSYVIPRGGLAPASPQEGKGRVD